MLNGHGDDLYRYRNIRINFSSNVYNHFDHEDLFCYLADQLDSVTSYPEPTPKLLEHQMSTLMNVCPEELMMTSGATEAIYLIAQTYRRKESAILMPTFSEYADACRIHEHQIINIYDLQQITTRHKIVWICNPNNPTGAVLEKERLLACIDNHPDTLFVIDASYAPFTLKPVISPTDAVERPNVLLLHSMTKEFALPGLRLGYVIGQASLMTDLRHQRMPWSVNQVAISAAEYLLRHLPDYDFDVNALMCERERVAHQLSALGVVKVWPSDSHILLCKLSIGRADALKAYLASEHGILIRDASNFTGLDSSYFRISVQTPEEDDELIKAITEWIAL